MLGRLDPDFWWRDGRSYFRGIGKIMESKLSMSINSGDKAITHLPQLDLAVSSATITLLSLVFCWNCGSDHPNRIELKAFHFEIQKEHRAIVAKKRGYQNIPLTPQLK